MTWRRRYLEIQPRQTDHRRSECGGIRGPERRLERFLRRAPGRPRRPEFPPANVGQRDDPAAPIVPRGHCHQSLRFQWPQVVAQGGAVHHHPVGQHAHGDRAGGGEPGQNGILRDAQSDRRQSLTKEEAMEQVKQALGADTDSQTDRSQQTRNLVRQKMAEAQAAIQAKPMASSPRPGASSSVQR